MKIIRDKILGNMSQKTKAFMLIGAIILLVGILFQMVRTVNRFFENNYFQFNRIIEVQINRPIEIKKRETAIKYIELLDYPSEINTPLEQYICDKFGAYDCKTALAIAKAESGMREEVFGVNTNGSIDVGVFQINSIHFKKLGCSLKEIVNAEKNVDCAFEIFSKQGWTPWTVFKTGSFRSHI